MRGDMMRKMMPRLLALALLGSVPAVACNGTTGDALITFPAYASGVSAASQPFTTYVGANPAYSVQLTRASMYIGALYFDESPPSTGFDTPICITPDIYAAQVPGGLEVNLLSATPQPFATQGNGSADVALSWDIWLTNGDINATANLGVHIVDIQGVATRLTDHKPFSFAAIVTIQGVLEGPGARLQQSTTPGLPGEYPICKQRILDLALSPGVQFYEGGSLFVTVDPRPWLVNSDIDFANALETWDSADCQLDSNANATYENGKACGPGGTCDDGFVCNGEDNNCIAEFCIPDTNYPADTAISAAPDFFSAIFGGGTAAYGVSYSNMQMSSP
jgi:hypothetical protein